MEDFNFCGVVFDVIVGGSLIVDLMGMMANYLIIKVHMRVHIVHIDCLMDRRRVALMMELITTRQRHLVLLICCWLGRLGSGGNDGSMVELPAPKNEKSPLLMFIDDDVMMSSLTASARKDISL